MEKANFLYFEGEVPKGINLIMFWDSSVTFNCKNWKKKKEGAFLSSKPFNASK